MGEDQESKPAAFVFPAVYLTEVIENVLKL